jgi:tripartite-type tricarboxylate transporter receptor subunit TctC
MNGIRRRAAIAAACGMAMSGASVLARPGRYPWHPIKLVVAAPAGGPPDALARSIAEAMSKVLGQPIVIDNKPGGAGLIAAQETARAAPDGHTLMLSWIGNASSQALIARRGLDINRDFVHITQIASDANVLIAHPSTGFKTLADFLEYAKTHPDKLTYASSGNGSAGHLAMEMLKERSGSSLRHIPYRGSTPALIDLAAGRVDVMFINQDAVIPGAFSGALVLLAITSAQRNPLFPDVPTVAESGFPGYEATTWAGLSAPAGTPASVVETIHAAALEALKGPIRLRQQTQGTQIVASTPAQYQAFMRKETQKWAGVIKRAGIAID